MVELEAGFKESVDDYLATCAKLGDESNKPYSGKLTLRIQPSVHAAIATAAETSGKSLNKWQPLISQLNRSSPVFLLTNCYFAR